MVARILPQLLVSFAAPAVAALEVPFGFVEDGQAQVCVYAPGENQWAGKRFVDRVETLTGARLRLDASSSLPPGELNVVAIGTPETNPLVRTLLVGDQRVVRLGDQGYVLKTSSWRGRRVLLAAGQTLVGANNAVSEIVSWKLRLTESGAWVPGDLNESDTPALKYRILWNWDMRTNWHDNLEAMHAHPHLLRSYQLYEGDASDFLAHFKRAIDFFSDHKLNGLVIWGFIRDQHGGLEAARDLSQYARQRNVRILPGVCTEAVYGGFSFARDCPYNLDAWTERHPELRFKRKDGQLIAGICPSKVENQQWLKDGTEWLLENLPDIGGANLENGDLYCCWTDDCAAARRQPGCDQDFFWDQMATYQPVIEAARRLRPDVWMVFATYTGFAGRSLPQYLGKVPESSICQWTLTAPRNLSDWPVTRCPSAGGPTDHIGYLKMASTAVTTPSLPDRWWVGPPGAAWDEVAGIIARACRWAQGAGMAGLVIYGELGAASPANELNYLALEYFGWHPERTWGEFVADRLAMCYGDERRAQLFLKLLRDTTRDPREIEKGQIQAARVAAYADLDVRQRARWRNLVTELGRRARLAVDLAKGE